MILILAGWLPGVLLAYGQKVDFFSEDLTFRLQKEIFEVDGLYFFRNNTALEINQTMIYPFPDVKRYGKILFLSITKAGDTSSMIINQKDQGALFIVNLLPGEQAAYHIIYRQQLKSNEAKYIILTTQKWRKPFETADYRLEIPSSLKLTHISINPDSTAQKNEKKLFFWHRENFMPDMDFEFMFELELLFLYHQINYNSMSDSIQMMRIQDYQVPEFVSVGFIYELLTISLLITFSAFSGK